MTQTDFFAALLFCIAEALTHYVFTLANVFGNKYKWLQSLGLGFGIVRTEWENSKKFLMK